jgi:hypothetical protein
MTHQPLATARVGASAPRRSPPRINLAALAAVGLVALTDAAAIAWLRALFAAATW